MFYSIHRCIAFAFQHLISVRCTVEILYNSQDYLGGPVFTSLVKPPTLARLALHLNILYMCLYVKEIFPTSIL